MAAGSRTVVATKRHQNVSPQPGFRVAELAKSFGLSWKSPKVLATSATNLDGAPSCDARLGFGKEKAMNVQQARNYLHDHGIRATQTRISILLTLSKSKEPCTPTEVSDEWVSLGLCRPTVSRCLTELAEAGLIRRIQHNGKGSSFELVLS